MLHFWTWCICTICMDLLNKNVFSRVLVNSNEFIHVEMISCTNVQLGLFVLFYDIITFIQLVFVAYCKDNCDMDIHKVKYRYPMKKPTRSKCKSFNCHFNQCKHDFKFKKVWNISFQLCATRKPPTKMYE